MNLVCIKRGNEVIKLEKDDVVQLESNDTLFLLVSLYPIRFELETRTPTPSSSALVASVDIDNDSERPKGLENGSKKRPHSMLVNGNGDLKLDESSGGSDDEECIVLVKKPKMAEVTSTASYAKPEIPASNHWSGGLLAYLKDPSKFSDVVITYTEELVVIKDKYPKSLLHLLILPRFSIPTISHLTPAHIPLLEAMLALGNELGRDWLAQDAEKDVTKKSPPPSASTTRVDVGFHAVPSMTQLHMHVISDDFDSPALKNKKHWNSFQKPFFIPVSAIIETLQKGDKIAFNKEQYDKYLDQPLKCHRCNTQMSNLPSLKTHIASCRIKSS